MKKLIALVLAIISLVLIFTSCGYELNENKYVVDTIYVEYGDTLNGYYYEFAKHQEDIYSYVEKIKELNDFTKASDLIAGDRIKVLKDKTRFDENGNLIK